MTDIRRCCKCGRTGDDTAFYPSYLTRCKDCMKAQAIHKRQERLEYLRQWKQRNQDAYKSWRLKNREKRLAYCREWNLRNRERRARTYADWSAKNHNIVRACVLRRQAATRRALVQWADSAAINAIYERAKALTRETGVQHEVDHIYPLRSDWVCGLHCEANLRVVTRTENRRKSNRRVAEAA